MAKIKSPAYKNMSKEQLEASIKLGNDILEGDADLVELNEKSLHLRGGKGKIDPRTVRPKRARAEDGSEESDRKQRKITVTPSTPRDVMDQIANSNFTVKENTDDLESYLKKIALSEKTAFQKKVLTTLCQVPRGQYTTYGAMSKHLASSPRAVGNALKNNPFAPEVPCHRVLASGGGLGGFMGSCQ